MLCPANAVTPCPATSTLTAAKMAISKKMVKPMGRPSLRMRKVVSQRHSNQTPSAWAGRLGKRPWERPPRLSGPFDAAEPGSFGACGPWPKKPVARK